MPVRPTMGELISRLRTLVGDPAGADQAWSDQELQDALDRRRRDVRYLELTPAETLTPSATLFLDYYAPYGNWEQGEQLVDGSWQPLTAAESNRLVGHWRFAENRYPPVYLTGRAYDLYAAAADVLEAWASRLKLEYDFAADGQSFSRAQRIAHLLQLARAYRAQSWPLTASYRRDDTQPERR